MKILIVEDSREMRGEIKLFLEGVANEINECGDGSEALAAYSQHRPDWVLMDIMMKRVDGLTATRQVKAAFPDAKIMIVTSYNDKELIEAAREAGASEYVLKENLLEVRLILQKETSSSH